MNYLSNISSFKLAALRKIAGSICPLAVVFGTLTCLLGCVDEDRVLTAHCLAPNDALAAATFLPTGSDATVGALNLRDDALGTMLQVVPTHARNGGAGWLIAHSVVPQAVHVSHEMYWNSQSLHVQMKIDLDGEDLAEPSRRRIESTLLSGSGVVVWDVERQTMENMLHAINSDPEALAILKNAAPEAQHLVVSSRLLATYVGLFYTPGGGIWLSDGRGSASTPFITPWTFRIGNTNFHTRYACKAVDILNSKASSTQERVPAVHLYTLVRYDPLTELAARDHRVTDLELLGSALQATHAERQQ